MTIEYTQLMDRLDAEHFHNSLLEHKRVWRASKTGLLISDTTTDLHQLKLRVKEYWGTQPYHWWITKQPQLAPGALMHGHNNWTGIFYPMSSEVALLVGEDETRHQPAAGELIILEPRMLHGVEANNSISVRYSTVFQFTEGPQEVLL